MSQEVLEADSDERPDVMVEVRDLKTYYEGGGLLGGQPVRAVDGVSFDIKRGETLGLVGESGCGKTTLGRTLLQLEDATAGTINFDGKDVTTLSGDELYKWRRNAQMVFQDPDSSLNDRMTIGEIVREPLDVHNWKTPRQRRKKVRDLLDTVGLEREHYFRYPHQFSGGQRQRIGIARTLALNPEFIVLDEPVSALDVSVQAEIINLLEDLQKEFNLTYLFIAHDLSVVRHICDRVAVMYLGHIMEIGPTEELFTDPANPYTQALLSAIPEPDPTSTKERFTLRGTPPNPRFPPAGCPFSTRCPARIRPAEHEDASEEFWEGVNTLREIMRERKRAERSIRERISDALGRETRFRNINDAYVELFEGIEFVDGADEDTDELRYGDAFSEDLQQLFERVAELARGNDEGAALDLLDEEFGSICEGSSLDAEEDDEPVQPEYYTVSDSGRESLCHRHADAYRDVDDVLSDRHQ